MVLLSQAAGQTLPQVLSAEELRGLDVAGLTAQLGLAQQAIEIIQDQRQGKLTDLIEAQNALLEAQKTTHRIKVDLKGLNANSSKFLERLKVLKLLIKSEANG